MTAPARAALERTASTSAGVRTLWGQRDATEAVGTGIVGAGVGGELLASPEDEGQTTELEEPNTQTIKSYWELSSKVSLRWLRRTRSAKLRSPLVSPGGSLPRRWANICSAWKAAPGIHAEQALSKIGLEPSPAASYAF